MNKKAIAKAIKDYPTALTSAEAAEILRVSIKTVYKLIQKGELPAIKVGRENRIAKDSLINYLRQKDKTTQKPGIIIFRTCPNKR